MERQKAWNKIRESIPGAFYHIVHVRKLNEEIRLSRPVLKAQVNFTPYTELEKYNRELAELDELLEKERDFNKVKQEEFSKRWDLAYERQQMLNEAIQKFSDYHEGCEAKIEQDITRIRNARAEISEKDKEIRKLKRVVEKLNELKVDIGNRRDMCESFKDFMHQVVHSSEDEYSTIQDLIARFNDLKQIRDEAAKKTKQNLLEGVTAKTLQNHELQLFNDEEVAYLVYKSRLDTYKERLKSYNGGMNEKVILVKNDNRSKILESERSKTSICSLYLNLSQEMKQPAVLDETDVKGQLEFIQKFLGEMTKVTHKVRETLGRSGSDIVLVPDTFNPNRRHSCVNPRKSRSKSVPTNSNRSVIRKSQSRPKSDLSDQEI